MAESHVESDREFDIILWGATGFTGRLVAEYLFEQYGTREFRWALGGRNEAKLQALRREIGAEEVPIVVGDAGDADAMNALAARTRVLCTTVGPYAKYGSELVAACASKGTHYCDLTGELQWVRRMIDAHEDEATETGARIVPSSGFDCIPSDLGVYYLQREMAARHGVPCSRVRLRVQGFKGGASGGTLASMLYMLEESERDPEIRRLMADPYAINPKSLRSGPDSGDAFAPAFDDLFDEWTGPFVMAGINTRVVRRTNALLGFRYGKAFRYDEAVLCGKGPAGLARAAGMSAAIGGAMAAFAIGPIRRGLSGWLPEPGDGPSEEQRTQGYWDVRLIGEHPEDPSRNLRARLTGDRDPGYGSTSKMLGEAAVCLAFQQDGPEGGFHTPASAMGDALIERLQARAGVTFEISETSH